MAVAGELPVVAVGLVARSALRITIRSRMAATFCTLTMAGSTS
jgi:hypothetical protein